MFSPQASLLYQEVVDTCIALVETLLRYKLHRGCYLYGCSECIGRMVWTELEVVRAPQDSFLHQQVVDTWSYVSSPMHVAHKRRSTELFRVTEQGRNLSNPDSWGSEFRPRGTSTVAAAMHAH